MKLKDLFKSYPDMFHEEQTKYIEQLRIKRIPIQVLKKSKKQKALLSDEEQAFIDKILKGLK